MRKMIEQLKVSLWLVPTLIVILCVLFAILLLQADIQYHGKEGVTNWPWLFGAGAQGARQMLAVIAGSVITVGGVVFSITVVVLSLASNQYSPRVLRNFISDWRSQIVLGGFLGIYAYCLVVLRTVRGSDHDVFVPSIAILGSLLLALSGIGLMIFFIHHIADSIRATSIVRSVYGETIAAIDALYPSPLDKPTSRSQELPGTDIHDTSKCTILPSLATGYVQGLDLDCLNQIARENEMAIITQKIVGEFVIEGSALAAISKSVSPRVQRKIISAIRVGRERTFEQDIGFGVGQLVDVALKGLSPGINDTTTALICIDHLGALFCRLVTRDMKNPMAFQNSKFNVSIQHTTFESLLNQAFDFVRQSGSNNPAVLIRMVSTLEEILDRAVTASQVASISRQVQLVGSSLRKISSQAESDEIETLLTNVSQKIDHLRN